MRKPYWLRAPYATADGTHVNLERKAVCFEPTGMFFWELRSVLADLQLLTPGMRVHKWYKQQRGGFGVALQIHGASPDVDVRPHRN